MKRFLFVLTLVFIVQSTKADRPEGLFPTKLKITVLDNLGNIVQGATVKLFRTEEDYRAEQNQAYETMTSDEKGVVKFKKIDAVSYYLLVESDGKSNIGGGVQVEALQEGKTNKINTIIK